MDNTMAYLLMEVVIAVVCISLVLVFSYLVSNAILGLFHRHLKRKKEYVRVRGIEVPLTLCLNVSRFSGGRCLLLPCILGIFR